MSDERKFTIMSDDRGNRRAGYYIPWSVMAPHEASARRNHSQTLERLNQRGGLDVREALCVLHGVRWNDGVEGTRIVALGTADADAELAALVASSLKTEKTE